MNADEIACGVCGGRHGNIGVCPGDSIAVSARNGTYEAHIIKDPSQPYYFHFGNNGIMPHWHENIELLRFFGDSVVYCDRKEYAVHRDNIAIVNSNSLHSSPISDKNRYNCLIIDNSFLEKAGIDVSKLKFEPVISDARIIALFDRVGSEVKAARSGMSFANASVQAAILELSVSLCRNYSHEADPGEKNGGWAVRKAIGYIKSHLDTRLTIDKIAENVNVSKYYFCREFHRETGLTVVRYINNLRCREAENLLLAGEYSISEIARMCGFENASYFSRIYKQTIGKTPSESIDTRGMR